MLSFKIFILLALIGSNYRLFGFVQKCRNPGESYSAAYLIHMDHFLHQSLPPNESIINLESAVFMMLNTNRIIMGFLHLSIFERLHRRWFPLQLIGLSYMYPILESAVILKHLANKRSQRNITYFKQTLVIIPFLGVEHGDGHSLPTNRALYLQATFYGLYRYFKHIVVCVKDERDEKQLRMNLNLPLYDIIKLDNVHENRLLPTYAIQEVKRRVLEGLYKFNYVYYTEADQIFMGRNFHQLYNYLNKYTRHVLVPHRLMTYPEDMLTVHHNRTLSTVRPMAWEDMHCCFPRDSCNNYRSGWITTRNSSVVPIKKILGLQVILGHYFFQKEIVRPCVPILNDDPQDYYPFHETILKPIVASFNTSYVNWTQTSAMYYHQRDRLEKEVHRKCLSVPNIIVD